jgi:multiple sugar transport system permease protein
MAANNSQRNGYAVSSEVSIWRSRHYTSTRNKKTALGLQDFYKTNSVLWQQLMTASTLMVLPVVLLFFFLQRYFIEGIALTGLKG